MERKILELFLTKNRLKFNEIEKLLKIRSNKLDYHIKKLISKEIIEKEGAFYKLTEASEYLIPYISEKNSILPVILVMIGNNKEVFLYRREKRPYKGFLSLPGGRIIIGEEISDAVKRIMKEKHSINVKFDRINSISLEHIYKNKKIINSFLLILTTAKTNEKINFIDVEKNKSKIISSDYTLIKKDRNKKINIEKINSKID